MLNLDTTSTSGISYQMGNINYFANSRSPRSTVELGISPYVRRDATAFIPITVIAANESRITGEFLETTITSYLSRDDVFSKDFLGSIYILSPLPRVSLDKTALEYLNKAGVSYLYLNSTAFVNIPNYAVPVHSNTQQIISPGPYTAMVSATTVSFLDTYRLYEDTYRNFITGAYSSNDGRTLPSLC
ncbi:hypothetical protein BO71DRAFT_427006 [Aspergillus ellipticus CBS 707.79]|uniref:Scytalone dehydratase-like protein Arp1 N-terminal domain-containing protein n=1 Tax=Aspergillus ellipticus CBS 707.79 TaxID=1448320 RepID=A0A319DJ11_9EURO|nr:hypothetical protein BO71DRAFT_427006 [Aspergillus ellipticus CBS 707.79]